MPIVLDIFPADRETRLFFRSDPHVLRRTHSRGLRRLHADVLEAFELARRAMRAGTLASVVPDARLRFLRDNAATRRRAPIPPRSKATSTPSATASDWTSTRSRSSDSAATNSDKIEIGDIVTIEPGLYFPDRELGVRIEDTFVVREDGRVETLCRSSRALTP